jgi:gliding motility-associated-like protein
MNNYVWDFGDGNTSPAPDPDHTYTTADSFEVKLIAISDKGCTDTIRKKVNVKTASIIADFTVSNVCKGDTVFFQNASKIINDTLQNFIWDFGDFTGTVNIPNPFHIYKDTGTYMVSLIAISRNGFKDTITHVIKVLPGSPLTVTKDTTIYQGQKVTLTAFGIFDEVLWSTAEQTPSIDVDTQGLYSVVVTDLNGCKAYDSVRVVVLERKKFAFMTVITPNSDGINDLWKIDEIRQYQPCKLVIYNRWGDELYSNSNYNNDWEGTYKGKSLPEGTYYFVLETRDGKVYKGAINILK